MLYTKVNVDIANTTVGKDEGKVEKTPPKGSFAFKDLFCPSEPFKTWSWGVSNAVIPSFCKSKLR